MSITVLPGNELFAFTVKDNRLDVTDYVSFFDKLTSNKCIVECKYPEYDSKGRLHYHGCVQIPKKVLRSKLNIKGLSMRFIYVYDMEGWLKYCRKDQEEYKSIAPQPVGQRRSLFITRRPCIAKRAATDELTMEEILDQLPDDLMVMPKRKLFK